MNLKIVWVMGCIGTILLVNGCDDSPTETEIPVQGVIAKGLDLSHHNIDNYAPIHWNEVHAAGYTFAFVKATDGYNSCWTDPTFVDNIETGHTAGMLMGAYHYARPDLNRDAKVEAECFLKVAERYLTTGYLRPVLDMERGVELGKAGLSAWVHAWMSTIKNRTGIEPLLYTYRNFTYNFDASVTQYDFWLAQYTGDPDILPDPGLWETWDFWQYTNQGEVPGVADPSIDLNLFNGDLPKLENEFVIQ